MTKQVLIKILSAYNFDARIIQAFDQVSRADFVPDKLKPLAYENEALPLGYGSTISQPYTIAFMLNLLELEKLHRPEGDPPLAEKILEIGSGCGYVLALLNEISHQAKIFGLEIVEPIAKNAQKILSHRSNIKIIIGNGFDGLLDQAPFDRILISAAAENLPKHLYPQLAADGIMVCPVQNSIWQVKKIAGKIITREFPGFIFVPLIQS